jgi:hypothetical protein
VKITADAAGDISWGKIVFTVSKSSGSTTGVLLGATTTLAVYKSGTLVNGAFATTTDVSLGGETFAANSTGGSIIFVPTNEEQIAAGDSATYELRANVSGIGIGVSYVNVSIAQSTLYTATTGIFPTVSDITAHPVLGYASAGFVWSDVSASGHNTTSSVDWTNDYLLTGLPLTLANSSVTN